MCRYRHRYYRCAFRDIAFRAIAVGAIAVADIAVADIAVVDVAIADMPAMHGFFAGCSCPLFEQTTTITTISTTTSERHYQHQARSNPDDGHTFITYVCDR